MFVLIQFPKIKEGCETDFFQWFEWTNIEFEKFEGFVSRQLLKSKNNSEENYQYRQFLK